MTKERRFNYVVFGFITLNSYQWVTVQKNKKNRTRLSYRYYGKTSAELGLMHCQNPF